MDIVVCRFVVPYCTFSNGRVSNPFSFVVDLVTVYVGPSVSDMSKLNNTVPKSFAFSMRILQVVVVCGSELLGDQWSGVVHRVVQSDVAVPRV